MKIYEKFGTFKFMNIYEKFGAFKFIEIYEKFGASKFMKNISIQNVTVCSVRFCR